MSALNRKQYVFCVSPGRSGTHYLSQVFGLVPEVCSVHEPEHVFPEYSELQPHNWNLKNRLLSDSFFDRRKLKLRQINDLMSATGAEVYVETNPMFCTLWHDVILNENSNHDIKVIILRRNSIDVLKSILDLGWYSERNGDLWMVSAYSVNSLYSPPWKEAQASPMDTVIGCLLNAELYTQKITRICSALGYKVIEISSDELFGDVNSVRKLLSMCDLVVEDQKIQNILKSTHNKPTLNKKRRNLPVETCAKAINEYLSACDRAGLEVPRLYLS